MNRFARVLFFVSALLIGVSSAQAVVLNSGDIIVTDGIGRSVIHVTTVRLTSSVFDAMIAYSMVYDIR